MGRFCTFESGNANSGTDSVARVERSIQQKRNLWHQGRHRERPTHSPDELSWSKKLERRTRDQERRDRVGKEKTLPKREWIREVENVGLKMGSVGRESSPALHRTGCLIYLYIMHTYSSELQVSSNGIHPSHCSKRKKPNKMGTVHPASRHCSTTSYSSPAMQLSAPDCTKINYRPPCLDCDPPSHRPHPLAFAATGIDPHSRYVSLLLALPCAITIAIRSNKCFWLLLPFPYRRF